MSQTNIKQESLLEISYDPCCTSILSIFKIPTDGNKTLRLINLKKKIDVLLAGCSKLIIIEIVNLLYPILEQICVCLCSKLNHTYQGGVEHDVYDMCNELYRIYNTYTLSLRAYNSMMKKDNQLTNLIEKNYPNLLNKCRSKNRTFQKSMTFNERYLKNENKDGKLIF